MGSGESNWLSFFEVTEVNKLKFVDGMLRKCIKLNSGPVHILQSGRHNVELYCFANNI